MGFWLIVLVAILASFLLLFSSLFTHFSDNIYHHGNRNSNTIALTFDDGPYEETIRIIEILKENNVSATFFVVGESIEHNPEIFKKLANSGNEIGIHSYTHPYLNFHLPNSIRREIESTEDLMKEYNVSSKLFRPPFGFVSYFMDWEAKIMGKHIILFDVASYDYTNISSEMIVKNVLASTKQGSIISLHDFAYRMGDIKNTPEALKVLIPELKKKYQLVTVSELLNFK